MIDFLDSALVLIGADVIQFLTIMPYLLAILTAFPG